MPPSLPCPHAGLRSNEAMPSPSLNDSRSSEPPIRTLVPQRTPLPRIRHLMRVWRWEHPPLRLMLAAPADGARGAGAEGAEVDVGDVVAT